MKPSFLKTLFREGVFLDFLSVLVVFPFSEVD
jgi:hypothetical protein